MKARLVTVTEAHVRELAASMRDEDLFECQAFGHATAEEALQAGLSASVVAWAVMRGDTLLAITGVVDRDMPVGTAYLWCLSSKSVEAAPVAYVRISHEVVSLMRARYRQLVAATPETYTRALHWLELLGFNTGRRELIGGVPFRFSTIGGA